MRAALALVAVVAALYSVASLNIRSPFHRHSARINGYNGANPYPEILVNGVPIANIQQQQQAQAPLPASATDSAARVQQAEPSGGLDEAPKTSLAAAVSASTATSYSASTSKLQKSSQTTEASSVALASSEPDEVLRLITSDFDEMIESSTMVAELDEVDDVASLVFPSEADYQTMLAEPSFSFVSSDELVTSTILTVNEEVIEMEIVQPPTLTTLVWDATEEEKATTFQEGNAAITSTSAVNEPEIEPISTTIQELRIEASPITIEEFEFEVSTTIKEFDVELTSTIKELDLETPTTTEELDVNTTLTRSNELDADMTSMTKKLDLETPTTTKEFDTKTTLTTTKELDASMISTFKEFGSIEMVVSDPSAIFASLDTLKSKVISTVVTKSTIGDDNPAAADVRKQPTSTSSEESTLEPSVLVESTIAVEMSVQSDADTATTPSMTADVDLTDLPEIEPTTPLPMVLPTMTTYPTGMTSTATTRTRAFLGPCTTNAPYLTLTNNVNAIGTFGESTTANGRLVCFAACEINNSATDIPACALSTSTRSAIWDFWGGGLATGCSVLTNNDCNKYTAYSQNLVIYSGSVYEQQIACTQGCRFTYCSGAGRTICIV